MQTATANNSFPIRRFDYGMTPLDGLERMGALLDKNFAPIELQLNIQMMSNRRKTRRVDKLMQPKGEANSIFFPEGASLWQVVDVTKAGV